MMMGGLDGLLSVAAVMLGVGGGTADLNSMRLAGLAAWIAGALSMFLGEKRIIILISLSEVMIK